MKPARGYKPNPLWNYDFVIGIKDKKITVLKDRIGETSLEISLSELFQRALFAVNNKKIAEALRPLIEKLKILEVFQ